MKLFVGLLLVSSTATSAQSYARTLADDSGDVPLCATWSRRDIKYISDSAGNPATPGDAEFTAVDQAFATWQVASDSCSDFNFERLDRQPNVLVGKGSDNSNVVVFRTTNCRDVVPQDDMCLEDESCANKHHCWDHSDAAIGLTTATFSKRTGVIVDADIELNASVHLDGETFLFTTISHPPCEPGNEAVSCVAFDIQNTMTHEIGHLLGFDHVADLDSTMAPTADVGDLQKRVIDQGTLQGLCDTYPKGSAPVPCDETAQLRSRIVARTIACSSTGQISLVAMALVFLRLRARRH